ncbi:hypothetical protein [Ruminiclostridium cellulolyticum]|uniref:Uncharacterized protein n=1 Tax=Ruminiclostridium cellulolyticum (strain ATCC 35319 / DSM 5812 / JCM 6584 / H10) TaxID=394503 RepID=B8I8T7_RUMCH|nr:hypothetical protein [Ruminiclostridium cellulolyticum]ACL77269.1 hypothetical protein Ccel_2975 [Ruminiclostridium cellulolyticum H10]
MFNFISKLFSRQKNTITDNPYSKPSVKIEEYIAKPNIFHDLNYIPQDETFKIDFINDRNNTVKNATVVFPAKNQYIIINDQKSYIDAYFVKYKGKSSDNIYHKFATPDYMFWVKPEDYERFKTVLIYRHNIKVKNKQAMAEFNKVNATKSFNYDIISNDIYTCFIAYKSGMCDAIGKWENFYKIEEALSNICKQNNGRYYKTENAKAKFAIIFNPSYRIFTTVTELKNKGFKVTTFEDVVDYFKLNNLWDTNKIRTYAKENQEYMQNHYN